MAHRGFTMTLRRGQKPHPKMEYPMPIPPFAVPQTTSADIKKLAKIFKPVKIKGDKAFLINCKDLENSFLWNAEENLKPYKGDLFTLYKFHSVHSYGYQGMFKPSITEVLAQIPGIYHFLKEAYFETVGPEDANDLNMWIEHIHAGVHVATTTLYTPEPSLDLMMKVYREHPESLSREGHVTNIVSAVRWMEAMKPEERLLAMRFFCHKCGVLLGTRERPITCDEVAPTGSEFCDECLAKTEVKTVDGQ